jgi:hypothetical protein
MSKEPEMPELPELPEVKQAAFDWAERMANIPHFLYYRRSGKKAYLHCSTCGEHYEGRTDQPVTIEDNACCFVGKPVHGAVGICRKCGRAARYAAEGKLRRTSYSTWYWITGQAVGEDYVFRAFRTESASMVGEETRIWHTEYARVVLRKGKRPQKWYYFGYYTPADWHPYNTGGYSNIAIRQDHYFHEWKDEIEKTWMHYADAEDYDPLAYYMALSWHPDLEMIQKLGMSKLERAIIGGWAIGWNGRGKTPAARLRINKGRLKDLREKKGDTNWLKVYQMEKKSGKIWTPKELEKEYYLSGIWDEKDKKVLRAALQHTSVEKLNAYIKGAPRQLYIDYIRMRIEEGYDLSNSVYLFPKDLQAAHDELVRMKEGRELDKRMKEVSEKYPDIRKNFGKLNKKYGYTEGEYTIRPAKSAEEIVMEGRLMHHCVGSGDHYISNHNAGKSYILLLRTEPEKPYVTIEIRGKEILQWYEAYDKQEHKDIIQPVLDRYVKQIGKKKRKIKGGKDGRTRNQVRADVSRIQGRA